MNFDLDEDQKTLIKIAYDFMAKEMKLKLRISERVKLGELIQTTYTNSRFSVFSSLSL